MRKVSARGEVAWVHLDNVDAWLQERGGEGQPLAASSPKGSSRSTAAASANRAPLQRMGTSGLGTVIEVKDVIDGALVHHNVKESLREQYVQKLLDGGYSSVELIARMAPEDFDHLGGFLRPHRDLIREQAAQSLREKAALGKGACCRCVQ